MSFGKNLNDQQKEAVLCTKGPLLILAGAGSGKTHTLTQRIVYLCKNQGIAPGSIFCVTFTNKAAGEMRERIMKELGVEGDVKRISFSPHIPLIATFHSAGVFFLRQFIDRIGYQKNFGIYDDSDTLGLIKEILREEKIDEKENPARQIQSRISSAKSGGISPDLYVRTAESAVDRAAAHVYPRYEKKLKDANALDFDDILAKTVEVLRIPEVLEAVQRRFQYFCVDEYQDTNALQYEIITRLASRTKNLCVVGDDWQGIYSWRGADIRNILDFKKDYPEAVVVKLEQNYRSTKTIIGAANHLIKKNKTALDKSLWTENTEGEKIRIHHLGDDRAEAMKVASEIRAHAGPLSSWAVLYRTNAQSRVIEEALLSSGIPYRIYGGLKFYDRKEIKDVLAYLRLLYNPKDGVAFARIVNTPARKIGPKTIEIVTHFVQEHQIDYVAVAQYLPKDASSLENMFQHPIDSKTSVTIEGLRGSAAEALSGFYAIVRKLSEEKTTATPRQLIQSIIQQVDYEGYLKQDYSSAEVEGKMENLKELQNLASQYEGFTPEEGLTQFLESISLMTDQDRNQDNQDKDFVSLMTIHSSKGLEFPHVIVTGFEEGVFPHSRALVDHAELEEERRLAYVAMTRAKRKLFLMRAKERFFFGNYTTNPPSRFLKEIPEEFMEEIDDLPKSNPAHMFSLFSGGLSGRSLASSGSSPAPKREKNSITQFSVGDRISHTTMGEGTIVALSGTTAQIAFAGKGIRAFNIELAPVKKI